MTKDNNKLQQVLLKLEMDYAGHPYYVSGNALLHALSSELSYDEQRKLNVSHGMFVPSVYGSFNDEHSGEGGRPNFGSGLKDVENYADLFLFRTQTNEWIIDGRPRDAYNIHDIKIHSGRPIKSHRNKINHGGDGQVRSGKGWYIHFYVHGDSVPLNEDTFDGLQIGGKRNYGYGETSLKDTQIVELDELDYSWLKNSDDHVIELVTPYVLESEYPKAGEANIPWWWDDIEYRYRKEKVLEQRTEYEVQTVDHGQVTGYQGDRVIKTAKNGVARIGTHSKYGFGEFMVRPA